MRKYLMFWILIIVGYNSYGQLSGNEISEDTIFGIQISKITYNNSDSIFDPYSYKRSKKNIRTINWRGRDCSILHISTYYIKYLKNKIELSIIKTDNVTRIELTLLKFGQELSFKDVIIGKTLLHELTGYEIKGNDEYFQYLKYKNVILGIKENENVHWDQLPIIYVEI